MTKDEREKILMFRKISENEAESDSDKTENGKNFFFFEFFLDFFVNGRF